MSAQSHATSMSFSGEQLLGVSTQPSPIEQPLSPPYSEGEQAQANGRKTKHVGRSCILCRDMRQKCDDDRPCKRCQARNEECLDSPEPDRRRRPAAARQLKEAQDHSKMLERQVRELTKELNRRKCIEAFAQQLMQTQKELEKRCCQQAQVLRFHGYEQPIPLDHPPHDPTKQPTGRLPLISTNQDFGPHRAPSAAPSAEPPSPADSSSPCLGWNSLDDDVFSNNSSNDPCHDEPGYSSGDGSFAISTLVPPLLNVSIAGGSANSMGDGMTCQPPQYQHQKYQQYLSPPRPVRHGRSRSDAALSLNDTRIYHQRALGGHSSVDVVMSTDSNIASLNARGSHSAPADVSPLAATTNVSASAVPSVTRSYGHPHIAANLAPTFAASSSAKSALPAYDAAPTFHGNSWLPGANSMCGHATVASSQATAGQTVPAHVPSLPSNYNSYPQNTIWNGVHQSSHSSAPVPVQDSRMQSAYAHTPLPQPASHPHQQVWPYLDHVASASFNATGIVPPHNFSYGPPGLQVIPSSPRLSHTQAYAVPH